MPALHLEDINTDVALANSRKRVARDLAAVMLADGQWYTTSDPTLPDGPTGYLSFLQHLPRGDGDRQTIMVNVPLDDVKAFAYFGTPQPA